MFKKFTQLSILPILVALSAPAHALETQIYNGMGCSAVWGADAVDLLRSPFIGIANVGNVVIGVNCPVVRKNHNNLNGTSDVRIRVKSADGEVMQCNFSSLDARNSLKDYRMRSTDSDTVVTLRLDVNKSARLGSYTVVCHLPPGAKVLNYKIVEY